MIWVVSQDIGVNYGHWVRLYQSRHFEDEFPEDNERFNNVIYTDEVEKDREKSLLAMRERMFSEHKFKAAVFIGGDRKSTRLKSSHSCAPRMRSSACKKK